MKLRNWAAAFMTAWLSMKSMADYPGIGPGTGLRIGLRTGLRIGPGFFKLNRCAR